MDMNDWLAHEEDVLFSDLQEGRVDDKEYNRQLRDLHQEYVDMARESAQDAYDAETDRW